MPDETLITEIENLLSELVRLGGENERTSIVPNLTVVNAAPTNLTGWIIVSDDRDGDNILAKKVPGVIYNNNDLVNVMFLKGGEAIAFQQGSGSTSSGIWSIVPSTSTDIYYNDGDVGIGNTAPTTPLDVTGTVTITDDILHAGDTGTKVSFTPSVVEVSATSVSMLKLTNAAQDLVEMGDVAGTGDVDINFNNGDMFVRGSDGNVGIGTITPRGTLDVSQATATVYFGNGTGAAQVFFDGSVTSRDMIWQSGSVNRWVLRVNGDAEGGSDAGSNFQIISRTDAGGVKETVLRIIRQTGYTMVGAGTPAAKLHVDQNGTTDAVPTLYLNQADVSEEMIQFNTTIGTGNAIEAVGAKSLTVTHFIKVTLPGPLTRYIPVGTIA